MVDTVKFDPGIGDFVINFNEYINNFYSQLMALQSINQKRIKFRISAQKIENAIKNAISFYTGCLMWAYYIHNLEEEKEIVGNVFYNMPDDLQKDYDYLLQVNFMENYFDSFERDYQYYVGKKYKIQDNWRKILSAYSDFLTLNKGFVNTKTNKDIVLPEIIKKHNFNFDIKEQLDNSIEKKNLELLLGKIEL